MVCVLLLNSGCALFDAELHNRGGFLDKLADDYWFKADSKRMRALRAFAMQASLARIASVSPKNDSDRTMMAIRIGNATARAQHVIECGFTKNPVTGNPVDGDPCFYFDSLMVDYTTALFDLAMVAFPVEDTKNLLSVVVGGFTGPVGALDTLNGILGLAKEALKYGRVIGAIYRDTVELEVQVWISSASAPQLNVPPQFRVTPKAVAELQAAYARGNDNMPVWVTQIAALRAAGLEPVPDPRFMRPHRQHFQSRLYHMRRFAAEINRRIDNGAGADPGPSNRPEEDWSIRLARQFRLAQPSAAASG